MQVSEDMVYLTDRSGEVIPMRRDRIRWVKARGGEDGTWEIEVNIDGWPDLERWIWKPEDGAGDFREYLEYLAPRKDYIYEGIGKNFITLIRGRDIVSVNVSGGYVDHSDGFRSYGSLLWLRWQRNARKKWKKHRGRRGDLKEG